MSAYFNEPKPINNPRLTQNLVAIEEAGTTYIVPKYNADRWDKNHSTAVKRAGSVVVLAGPDVVKNLFKKL